MNNINLDFINEAVKNINYNDVNLEIAWQIELIIWLRQKLGTDYRVLPEMPLAQKDIKKEIDIVIENITTHQKSAIELKMPLKSAYPRRMSQAIIDIAFLENLKKSHSYSKCFFIMMTNNSGFWSGREQDNLYQYFRKQENLTGKIQFSEFFTEVQKEIQLDGIYKIEWQDILENWKYFILEV